jgi:predicted phage-related endonuclease
MIRHKESSEMKVLTTAAAGSAEWLAARRGKITASRAANIMASSVDGAEPGYRSRLQEWHDLKAELSGEASAEDEEAEHDEERAERMAWGLESEPLHALKLGQKLGEDLVRFGSVVADDEYPWLVATPDYVSPSTGAPRELKAVGQGRVSEWRKNGTPFMYVCQLGVQQRILGVREDGVVSGYAQWNGVYRPHSVEKQHFDLGERAEHFLLGTLEAFWASIEQDIPPEPGPGDYEALREMARPQASKKCRLPMSLWDEKQVIDAKIEQRKAIEAEEEAFKAKVAALMVENDAEIGVWDDGSGYTFKSTTRNYKAQEARVMVTKPSLKFSATIGFKS